MVRSSEECRNYYAFREVLLLSARANIEPGGYFVVSTSVGTTTFSRKNETILKDTKRLEGTIRATKTKRKQKRFRVEN
ncbi:hypothetical protein EFP84_13280 [Leptospira kmetyi]|uniref:Uncharacterized protein n=1 Tax=Leptospira kmetyi TaxID=408139 RepID=A0AAD0UPX7_9LEPT|nr:hypothetical protein EFP84_13280 [Leptospira kmetyi]